LYLHTRGGLVADTSAGPGRTGVSF